jgi:HEAT repeat protein
VTRPKTAVPRALDRMRGARSVDAGDDAADELARAARQNLPEVLELLRTPRADTAALVWCLQGQTSKAVLDVLLEAAKHRESQVRWAALEGLKHFTHPAHSPVFMAALSDRSHLVKTVAVEWRARHGDVRAIAPLERLIALPSMVKTSPGLVRQARATIRRLRAKA